MTRTDPRDHDDAPSEEPETGEPAPDDAAPHDAPSEEPETGEAEEEPESAPSADEHVVRLGLIAEPDMPARVVEHLNDQLPDDLDGSGRSWTTEVSVDSLAAGRASAEEILVAAAETRDARGWDYAIVVTDLPLRDGWRAILAHADPAASVAIVCLPALGATQPFRRAAQITRQLVDDLTGHSDPRPGPDRARAGYGLRSNLTRLFAPIRRLPAEEGQPDQVVRYGASRRRGMARLLAGMVRTNRPWRLVYSLSGALAAAFAASAFGLSSSTIWQISTQTGPWRISIAAVAAIAVLVAWLIGYHGLWESRARGAPDREVALLYNGSTLLTLLVGVSCMFAVLLVVNTAIAVLLVPTDLMSSTLGTEVTWADYGQLACGFTTMGLVAGALGSSFESDDAVRQAAYGYRERRRRAAYAEEDRD